MPKGNKKPMNRKQKNMSAMKKKAGPITSKARSSMKRVYNKNKGGK